jgi:hypothetical protein
MESLKKHGIVLAVTLAFPCAAALADLTFITSNDTTIYRVSEEGDVESFTFNKYFHAMHRDTSTGTIYVLGNDGGGTPPTVYTLNNPVSGAITLTPLSDLSLQYGSITQIGDLFYGFRDSRLWTIDLSDSGDPVETLVGDTYVTNMGGSAYDPVGEALYMLSYDTDSLHLVDPDTGDATTVIGSLGISFGGCGAEWYAGQMYAGLFNVSSGAFEIGTVDVASGMYSSLLTIGTLTGATGITVVPEPTAGLIMICGFALALRRR